MLQIKPKTFNSYKEATKPSKPKMDANIKGYLLNNQIKSENNLNDLYQEYSYKPQTVETLESSFDMKNALKPIAIATAATLGTITTTAVALGAYSKSLANSKFVVRPPDLARNINIVEEPQFAMYRALRDPNAKNILGLIGVGAMSGVTLCAKNFVDGFKEIWIKKQENDIQYDYQKDLINIETKVFSGKLGVINSLVNENSKKLKNDISFRGNIKQKENEKKSKKPLLLAAAGVLGFSAMSGILFKNYQKIVLNLQTFLNKTLDSEIKAKIETAINEPKKQTAIENLVNVLKTINAPKEKVVEHLNSIKGINPDEVQSALKEVLDAQIYVKAPEALGGVSEKIQYYCYINEDRGHLYNWILNPENKFNKYIFLSFSAISALGYVAKSCADAIKSVTVKKETTKNELNLKEKLVDVEIKNFESKKRSAIAPMIKNYEIQKQKGATKEELNETAQSILLEIKNGPPYVYD